MKSRAETDMQCSLMVHVVYVLVWKDNRDTHDGVITNLQSVKDKLVYDE